MFKTHYGDMCGSLVGLSSNEVAYAQQAASHVQITVGNITAQAEITTYNVSSKGSDVINVRFYAEDRFSLLHFKITKQSSVSVQFILKRAYFQSLHKSLDSVNFKIISCLIPSSLQPDQKLPRTSYFVEDSLWLDKEYQLLALKKIIACDSTAPFLLTGPFGTGKTRLLAAAAVTFLKSSVNRVLICTSHLCASDTYIDKYFGPMMKQCILPRNVNPVRLVANNSYQYFGKFHYLFKSSFNHQERKSIRRSRLIITTYLTAMQLINLKVKSFTHILIDEGAQRREPETIAPLCLANNNTKIVIAGDYLQV